MSKELYVGLVVLAKQPDTEENRYRVNEDEDLEQKILSLLNVRRRKSYTLYMQR